MSNINVLCIQVVHAALMFYFHLNQNHVRKEKRVLFPSISSIQKIKVKNELGT